MLQPLNPGRFGLHRVWGGTQAVLGTLLKPPETLNLVPPYPLQVGEQVSKIKEPPLPIYSKPCGLMMDCPGCRIVISSQLAQGSSVFSPVNRNKNAHLLSLPWASKETIEVEHLAQSLVQNKPSRKHTSKGKQVVVHVWLVKIGRGLGHRYGLWCVWPYLLS